MTDVDQFTHPGIVAAYDLMNGYDPGTQPDFYRNLARDIGQRVRIIDLGCGTGLVSAVLADDGHEVFGVEPSSAMLEAARSKDTEDRVTWALGGHESIESWNADLAIMSGHVAQFFVDDEEWVLALASLRRGLRDGGVLSFESRNPDAREWARWGRHRQRVEVPGYGLLEQWTEVRDMSNGVLSYEMHYRFVDAGEELVASDRLRFRTLDELTESLVGAGFTVDEVYGDWDRGPVASDRPELVVVART